MASNLVLDLQGRHRAHHLHPPFQSLGRHSPDERLHRGVPGLEGRHRRHERRKLLADAPEAEADLLYRAPVLRQDSADDQEPGRERELLPRCGEGADAVHAGTVDSRYRDRGGLFVVRRLVFRTARGGSGPRQASQAPEEICVPAPGHRFLSPKGHLLLLRRSGAGRGCHSLEQAADGRLRIHHFDEASRGSVS